MNENELNNFIPISRKLFENDLWKEKREFSKAEAWIDLIQSARYKEGSTTKMIDNKLYTWNRGELVASYRYLAKRWGWKSLNKVRRFLDILKNLQQIGTTKEQGLTKITLCNYETYNSRENSDVLKKERRGNSEGTPKERNRNKENKDNNVYIPEYPEFLEYAKTLPVYHSSFDFQLKAKYNSWKENKWRDGYNKPISNWKTKLQNTITYFKKDFSNGDNGKHEPEGKTIRLNQ